MGGAAAAGWMDSCPVIPVTTRVCDGSAANHCMMLTQSASLTTPTCHHPLSAHKTVPPRAGRIPAARRGWGGIPAAGSGGRSKRNRACRPARATAATPLSGRAGTRHAPTLGGEQPSWGQQAHQS